MIKVFIISIGNELINGENKESNSIYLSNKMDKLGARVTGRTIVGDNEKELSQVINNALEIADIVLCSGGLGPTSDDISREGLSRILGISLELCSEEEAKIKDFFVKKQRDMPKNNLKQAMFPANAYSLANKNGTAPGIYLKIDKKILVLLPGPPHEMSLMFEDEVILLLKKDFSFNYDVKTKKKSIIKLFGIGESKVEEIVSNLFNEYSNTSVAYLVQDGEIQIKLESNTEDSNLEIIKKNIIKRLDEYIFGFDEDSLLSICSQLLRASSKKLVIAESCTGGNLSKQISDIPGSSEYFWGSVVSYSNEAKLKLLGVKQESLESFGAVSKEVALEMAKGVLEVANADIAISITGIAGPTGSDNKPLGLVYISLVDKHNSMVFERRLLGDREMIRSLASKTALDLLQRYLKNNLKTED